MIPHVKKAILLQDYAAGESSLQIQEMPLAPPCPGQVLIQMAAASINPSDLVSLRGRYGIRKSLPVVPGLEGSGTVVAAGGGLYARLLVGRRVACSAPHEGDGTWADYMVTEADRCIPLRSRVSFEQGCSLIVNPLTAWLLFQKVRETPPPAFVQTAAASAVGRMLARLSIRHNIPCVHIVRRKEQVELLKALGGSLVLDSNAPDFDQTLRDLCRQHRIRTALDAVGGELTQRISRALLPDSRIIVYGALAGESCAMDPWGLIFEKKKLEGFWLTKILQDMPGWRKWLMAYQVQGHLEDELQTHVQGRFVLEEIQQALQMYKSRRTDGKVLLLIRPTPKR